MWLLSLLRRPRSPLLLETDASLKAPGSHHCQTVCHFCNAAVQVTATELTEGFTCPDALCGQYNGFAPDGDYNLDMPETYTVVESQRRRFSSSPQKQPHSSMSPLCEKCTENQDQRIRLLAAFVPDDEDDFDAQVDAYARALDAEKPLCAVCRQIVDAELDRQRRWLSWLNFSSRLRSSDRVSVSSTGRRTHALGNARIMAARLTRLWVALVLLALLTATTSTLLVHANRHSHHATNDIPLVTSPTCRHLTHLGAPLRALMSAFHLIDSPRSLFACATTTTTHSCHATVACHLGSGAVIATVLSFYAVALASLLELHQRLTTRPALLSLLFTLFVTLLTALPRLLLRSYLYSDLWFLFLLSFSLLTSLTLNLTALRYTSRTLPFPTYSNTNSTVPSRAQSPNSSRAPSPHSDYLSGSALSDPMTIESLSISQRQKSPTVTPTPPTATPTAAAATTTTTTTESRRQQQTEGESQLIRPARLGYRPETISHLRARESQLFRHPTSSSSSSSAHASSALPLNVLSQLQTSLSLKERSLTDSFRRALSPICLLSLLFALSLAINIFLASRSIAPKSEL